MHPGLVDRDKARCNRARKGGAIVAEGEITVYTTTHWQSIPPPFRCFSNPDKCSFTKQEQERTDKLSALSKEASASIAWHVVCPENC